MLCPILWEIIGTSICLYELHNLCAMINILKEDVNNGIRNSNGDSNVS